MFTENYSANFVRFHSDPKNFEGSRFNRPNIDRSNFNQKPPTFESTEKCAPQSSDAIAISKHRSFAFRISV